MSESNTGSTTIKMQLLWLGIKPATTIPSIALQQSTNPQLATIQSLLKMESMRGTTVKPRYNK